MGWKTAGLIRVSGLTDGTDVDVLEAIASFLNEEDGRCFPALESVMLVARKSRNIVRQSIKTLCVQGLLSFSAEPGKVRSYVIHVHNLPEPKLDCFKEFFRTELCKKGPQVQKLTRFRSEPGSEVNREGGQKCTPTGFRSEPGGGSEMNPEQGNEQVSNREQNKEVMCAPSGAPQPPEMSDDEIADLLDSVPLGKGSPFPEKGDHPSEKDAHLSSGDKKPARKKPATTAFCAVPRPDDVDPQVWSDWMAVRKRKNKPLTETAFNFLKSQAEKAGISTARAIELCAQNGWLGFREEYLRNSFSRNSNSYQPAMKTPIKRKRAEDYVWKVK